MPADQAAPDIRSDDIDTADKAAAPTESKSKIHKMDQPTKTEAIRERKRTQKIDEAGPAAAA